MINLRLEDDIDVDHRIAFLFHDFLQSWIYGILRETEITYQEKC